MEVVDGRVGGMLKGRLKIMFVHYPLFLVNLGYIVFDFQIVYLSLVAVEENQQRPTMKILT